MRKLVLLTILVIFSGYSIFAQDAKTDKKNKKKQQQETVTSPSNDENENYTPVMEEAEEDDDSGGNQYVPSLLHSSRDVYTNITSYAFSIAYFKPRGYDSRYQDVFINGYDMSSLITGRAT